MLAGLQAADLPAVVPGSARAARGAQGGGGFAGVKAAIQGHYGEQDSMFSVEDAKKQEQQIRDESGAEVEYFYYDAPHAFHNDDDPQGNYRPEAAALAWGRAVAFLKEKVR